MLLSWIVRVHDLVSIDPHDDLPLVSIFNRETRNFETVPRLHSLGGFDPGAEGSWARSNYLWKSSIQRERRDHSGQVVQRTEGGDQKDWRCKDTSPIVRRHAVLTIVAQYYARALSTSVGQKVQDFYTKTSKHVLDIHEEAKRLAGWHKTNTVEPPADVESSTKED